MRYQIKKLIFFLFAFLSIPVLFAWILYDLDSALDIGHKIGIEIVPDYLFRGDAIMLPLFLSILFPIPGSLIYLIFYRRECCIWPKLLMLFAGTSAFIVPYLADDGHHPAIKNASNRQCRDCACRHHLAHCLHGKIPKASVEIDLNRPYRSAKHPAGRDMPACPFPPFSCYPPITSRQKIVSSPPPCYNPFYMNFEHTRGWMI